MTPCCRAGTSHTQPPQFVTHVREKTPKIMLDWLLPNLSWPAQDAGIAQSLESPKLAIQRDHLANGVSFLEPRSVIMSCVLLRGDAEVPALAGGL